MDISIKVTYKSEGLQRLADIITDKETLELLKKYEEH